MKEKLMYQCVLRSDNARMVVWLSNEIDFKVGDFVTLKTSDDPKRKWKVMSKGGIGHKTADIKQTWKSQDLIRDPKRKKIT